MGAKKRGGRGSRDVVKMPNFGSGWCALVSEVKKALMAERGVDE